NHLLVYISSGSIATEFILHAEDALSKERRLAARSANEKVIGQNLLLVETVICVERQAVRLKCESAAEALGEEIGSELKGGSRDWIKAIWGGIALNFEA